MRRSAIPRCVFASLILTAFCSVLAAGEWQSGGHWLHFRGRPILLIGESITQGWMELGTNFDQRAYIAALARRGINVLLLWSYIGVTDQSADTRIGYDAPELWPWLRGVRVSRPGATQTAEPRRSSPAIPSTSPAAAL